LERKRYVQVAAVVIAILILGAAFYNYVYVPSLPRELMKFRYVAPVPLKDGFWEMAYANDTGIFREEGLEVEVIILRTPTEVAQTLLSGDADGIGTVDTALSAYLAGAEQIRVVNVQMRPSFALWVKPEVNSIQDVKSVAVPGRGSAADFMTRKYLLKHGLEPDVDVSIQYLAITTMLPAFLAGQVDATAGGVSSYPLMRDGKGKILFQFAAEFPQWTQSGLVVTQKTITERPELVKAFVRAQYRSMVALIQNKEKAIEYAVNVLGIEKDYATFVYDFAYTGKYGAATKMIPAMPLEDLEYTMGVEAEMMNVQAKPIQGCVDTTFIDQVKKELG